MTDLHPSSGEVNCVIVADPSDEVQRSSVQDLIRDNWSATQFSRKQSDNRLILSKGGFGTTDDASRVAAQLIPKINVVASGTSTTPLLRLDGIEDIETQMILDPGAAGGTIGTILKNADVTSRPIILRQTSAQPPNTNMSNASDSSKSPPVPETEQSSQLDPPRVDDQLSDDELFDRLKPDQSQQLAAAILRARYGLLSPDEQIEVEATRVDIIKASLRTAKALTTGIKLWNLMALVAPIFLLVTIFLSATLLSYGFTLTQSGSINGYEFSVVIFLAAIYAISPATLLLLQRPLKNLEGTTVPGTLPTGDGATT